MNNSQKKKNIIQTEKDKGIIATIEAVRLWRQTQPTPTYYSI